MANTNLICFIILLLTTDTFSKHTKQVKGLYFCSFKGHTPSNDNERLALGHALKMIHVGANKMISCATVLESYKASLGTQKNQYEYYKSLNLDGIRKGLVNLPQPITVRLNDHNINYGYKAILEAYQKHNTDSGNPYRQLENSNHWSLIHDATSHWVKEINTVFIRAVDATGNIQKVPFEMEQVPGSLTGEVLCENIVKQMSNVKKVEGNMFKRKTLTRIQRHSNHTTYKQLQTDNDN